MSYIFSHIQVAKKLIYAYKSDTPFAIYLKSYFSTNKKHGSKDRKSIAHLCYTYFRIGNVLKDLEFEKRINIAIFLCNNQPPSYATPLLQDTAFADWPAIVTDRLNIVKTLYPNFNVIDIFPEAFQLSELLTNKDAFIVQCLFQPKLFARIRPGKKEIVFKKLQEANVEYSILGDNCLSFENTTAIDSILKLDEQVVIQDFSSQKIADIFGYIKQYGNQTLSVWDCCAASGGKSILLYDTIKNISLTVSDIRSSIIANLIARFRKAGINNYNYFVSDTSQPNSSQNPTQLYDIVIADVPCTGSGTWGRTPEYLTKFDTKSIAAFSDKQQKILQNIINSVKIDGYIIYITCSAYAAENEQVVANMLTNNKGFKLIHQEMLEGYYHQADTMYAAVLQFCNKG